MQAVDLSVLRRLYDLGFDLHHLREKSKAPFKKNWTDLPRMEWREFERGIAQGYNVGVRLGKWSKVGPGYLATIDSDLKSSEERHRIEMDEKLEELFPYLRAETVEVRSGRANGSGHLYVLTKEPAKPTMFAKSKDRVEVHLPSLIGPKAKWTDKEEEQLGLTRVRAGWRLRPAWEIGIMGSGQQTALPPSIHPDTAALYEWVREPQDASEFVLIKSTPHKEEIRVEGEPFEYVDVDLNLFDISDETREDLQVDRDSGEQSSTAFKVAQALIGLGMTHNQITSVLLDRDRYPLAWVGFKDTRGAEDEQAAARWVHEYCTLAAQRKIDESLGFDKNVQVSNEEAERMEEADRVLMRGFYDVGQRGGLTPNYNALLKEFEKQHPFKTIADMRVVYSFNGTHYEEISKIEIQAFAENHFEPKPSHKIRVEFKEKVFANHIDYRSFFLDSTENKLNFKNGVLKLEDSTESQILLPHSPEYGFRGVLPYDFQPKAECPRFRKWISDIMLGDLDLQNILQEFMGYIVRGGEYRYHKALWLGGEGRNGKSTLVDLLKALIGRENFSTVSIKDLMQHQFASEQLDGKIANFSEETSPRELADSGPFKNLTGNGELNAQKKYGQIYTFRNRAKMVMTYNQIPDLKDLSVGMLSRPIIVPFRMKLEDAEQDRDIGKKLREELPGIFNFALEGWYRLERQQEFSKSDLSTLALQKIKEESCSVYQWVENNVTIPVEYSRNDPAQNFSPQEVFENYRKTERQSYGSSEFYRRLNKHPVMAAARDTKSHRRGYFGIKIRGALGSF